MIRLIYNNTAFRILNDFQISNSGTDVTFNDVTIDFTGYELADMPFKYQEIKIKECKDNEDILTEGKVLFLGYVDTVKPSTMQMSEEKRELNITLLSPRKLATVRTATIIGTYQLKDAIQKIFEPLINDGFTLEMNVPNSQMLLSYIMQPVETIMNNISQKKNLFWHINEKKEIKVSSIDYIFGQNIAKTIDTTEGLLRIEPSVQATDYANIINIRNVRLIYADTFGGSIIPIGKKMKNGDTIEFEHPVSIGKTIAKQIANERDIMYQEPIVLFEILAENFNLDILYYPWDDTIHTVVEGDNISTVTFSDNQEEGDIVLQRDSFFHDVITGLKYNGTANITINKTTSESALRYSTMKFVFSKEIQKLKGIISDTGQIEKSVDVNETWFTLQELTNYAKTLLIENTNNINTVILEYDTDPLLNIGDIVGINLEDFYTQGNFAVTNIKYTYKNEIEQNWQITLQNSDMLASYIDLFRPSQSQETEEQENSIIISEYDDELVSEIHNVEEVQDEG